LLLSFQNKLLWVLASEKEYDKSGFNWSIREFE